MNIAEASIGCILGTAVGDAMGLACEGLSKSRQRKLFPDLSTYHFFFGKGMISDDTEHTCLVAQALIASAGNSPEFTRHLASGLRWWILGLPAGIGFATLRACLKLWMGVSPPRSGVVSAGNGAAMRSAILGVYCHDDRQKMRELVKASTRITHTDPKAEFGATAIALAAQMASHSMESAISPETYLHTLEDVLGQEADDLLELVRKTVSSVTASQSTESFAEELGLSRGVSGYVYHTVPVVLHAWLRHQHDYRTAITTIIRCGGDTDTTAAILGAIIGASVGKNGIPAEWLANLWEFPRSVAWMEQLGRQLAEVQRSGVPENPVSSPLFEILPRNLMFMLIVLLHGFRRLFPPY